MALFIAIFAVYNTANAGFFSFFEKLKSSDNYIGASENTANIQTAQLLEGTANYDANAAKGGGDVTIVNNSSLLSESGPLGTILDVEEGIAHSDQISVYVVRSGDTLSQIAAMFNVSVNTIMWANDISKGNSIKIGQTLVILPVSGIRYTIKKGDTLASIAKSLHGEVEEIKNFNGITSDKQLAIGEILIVPNGEVPAPKVSTPSKKTTSPLRGANGPDYSGYYIRPFTGGVKTQDLHGYNGVDLADSCGTPILAAASGNVIISRSEGYNGGYGNYIVIDHSNGTQTLYSHLNKNIVFQGWSVVQGQVIGYMGSTGRSTGCHLHFEVRGAKNPF